MSITAKRSIVILDHRATPVIDAGGEQSSRHGVGMRLVCGAA
jgi:hypothetical protein